LYQSNIPEQFYSNNFPWHNSVTPAMMHTDSVRKLLNRYIPSLIRGIFLSFYLNKNINNIHIFDFSLESLILNDGATEFYLYDLFINLNNLWCDNTNLHQHNCHLLEHSSKYQNHPHALCLYEIQRVMKRSNLPILSKSLWKLCPLSRY